jgi:type IV pilus assembly protein PilV
MRMTPPRSHVQKGVSLIEALIALLLLCVGLLGIAGMHGRAVQYAVDGEDRNRAAILANEMVSLMWASRTNDKANLPSGTVTAWQARVTDAATSGLPNASSTIDSPDTNGVTKITISWRPPSRPSASGSFTYVTKVALP